MLSFIKIFCLRLRLKKSIITTLSKLKELEMMKNSKLKFKGLEEYDKDLKSKIEHAISEYEKFRYSIKQKLQWKLKYWYSLDLSRFNSEFNNAKTELDNLDTQIVISGNKLFAEAKKLGYI